MMDLNNMAKDCNEVSRSKGWLEESRSFGDLIALMHSELSEALEEFRDGRGMNEIYWKCKNCALEVPDSKYFDGLSVRCNHTVHKFCEFKPEGIPIEFADVIIRVLQACGNDKIDIQDAYNTKMQFNQTRPYRHGGKAL